MKHETPSIQATVRERPGTRYARRLREQGQLPAIIYGRKSAPLSVCVDHKQLYTLISHGAHALYLEIEGQGREMCLVRDLQYGYLGDNLIHVDFNRVKMDELVRVNVHLNFVGTPAEATRSDAILRQDLTELEIECKVIEIPEEIRVDLTKMTGTHLTAGEVPLPPGIRLIEDPESIVASVSFLREEAESTGEEAQVTAEAAEPEVITEAKDEDKGKD